MKKNYNVEKVILEGMTGWQEVVKPELSELKEEIGEKRQIFLRNEDTVGRISRENRHWKIHMGLRQQN